MTHRICFAFLLCVGPLLAQEQVDKTDAQAKAAATIARLTMRVRVTHAEPLPAAVRLHWRRGGEGLGGTVTRSAFLGADDGPDIALGAWTGWLAVRTLTGGAKGWEIGRAHV